MTAIQAPRLPDGLDTPALVIDPDAIIERVGDYHGVVSSPTGSALPTLGEVVVVNPESRLPRHGPAGLVLRDAVGERRRDLARRCASRSG